MSDKKRCFVLMGFGTKVDFKTNRSLDLDKTYKIIQLAIRDAGLSVPHDVAVLGTGNLREGLITRPTRLVAITSASSTLGTVTDLRRSTEH